MAINGPRRAGGGPGYRNGKTPRRSPTGPACKKSSPLSPFVQPQTRRYTLWTLSASSRLCCADARRISASINRRSFFAFSSRPLPYSPSTSFGPWHIVRNQGTTDGLHTMPSQGLRDSALRTEYQCQCQIRAVETSVVMVAMPLNVNECGCRRTAAPRNASTPYSVAPTSHPNRSVQPAIVHPHRGQDSDRTLHCIKEGPRIYPSHHAP